MNKEEKLLDSLSAFIAFKEMHPEIFNDVVNGAGPAKYGRAVRDKWFYGFSATNAANVHDYLYSVFADGRKFSRKDADDIFLKLMQKELSEHKTLSKIINTPIIYTFWVSVRLFGGLFWKK